MRPSRDRWQMLANVHADKGEIPTGFAAASALIDRLKKEKEGWTLSPMDMQELRKVGYKGDDPVTRNDYDEILSMQLVRYLTICPLNILSQSKPLTPNPSNAGGQQDRCDDPGDPRRRARQAQQGARGPRCAADAAQRRQCLMRQLLSLQGLMRDAVAPRISSMLLRGRLP